MNDNYGHWMVDFITRFIALKKSGWDMASIDHFILSPNFSEYAKETIKLLGIPQAKIIVADTDFHCECEAVVTTSIRNRHWQFTLQPWVPEYLKGLIPPASFQQQPNDPSALYLMRKKCSFRKVLDEDLLIGKLEKIGVVAVDPADYSILEQARLFYHSRLIISPHSSSLTNLCFAQKGCQVLEIFPKDYFDVSFWTMATAADVDYSVCFAEFGEGAVGTRREDMILGQNLIELIMRWADRSLGKVRVIESNPV